MAKASMKSDNVYQNIKDLIVSGTLKPGHMISVSELAEQFGVSVTPVRDSLNALKHEELVEILPHKGYFVSQVDLKELQHLFQMRMILETASVEIASRSATPRQIEQLYELANKDCEGPDSPIHFMKDNYSFHVTIAEASGNPYLTKSLSNVLNQMQRVLYNDLFRGNRETMKFEHLELVDLIRAGDPVKAREAIVMQIEGTKKRILSTF
ncbi:MAG: transcriptional regulator [Cohnella sp.]|jgi:DNA-binding GntR family transcriptional regulator|nr:transcriptional regulator [Cohnella sp.]